MFHLKVEWVIRCSNLQQHMRAGRRKAPQRWGSENSSYPWLCLRSRLEKYGVSKSRRSSLTLRPLTARLARAGRPASARGS